MTFNRALALITVSLSSCVLADTALIKNSACSFANPDAALIGDIQTAIAPYKKKCPQLQSLQDDAQTVMQQMEKAIKDQMVIKGGYRSGLLEVRTDCFNYAKVLLDEFQTMRGWNGELPEGSYHECGNVAAEKRGSCLNRVYHEKMAAEIEHCHALKSEEIQAAKEQIADKLISTASSIATRLLNVRSSGDCIDKGEGDVNDNLFEAATTIAGLVAKFEPVSAATSAGINVGSTLISALLKDRGTKATGPVYSPTAESEKKFTLMACLSERATDRLICQKKLTVPALPPAKSPEIDVQPYVDGTVGNKKVPSLARAAALLDSLSHEDSGKAKENLRELLNFMAARVSDAPEATFDWRFHLGQIADSLMKSADSGEGVHADLLAHLEREGIKPAVLDRAGEMGGALKRFLTAFDHWKSEKKKYAEPQLEKVAFEGLKQALPVDLTGAVEQYWTFKDGAKNPVSEYLRQKEREKTFKSDAGQSNHSRYALSVAYQEMLRYQQPFFEGRLKALGAMGAGGSNYQLGDGMKGLLEKARHRRNKPGGHAEADANRPVDYDEQFELQYVSTAEMCLFLALPMTLNPDTFLDLRQRGFKPNLKVYHEVCDPLACQIPVPRPLRPASLPFDTYCGEICQAMASFPNRLQRLRENLKKPGHRPCP